MTESANRAAQGEVILKVSKTDLPLCCPPQNTANAGLHPRVFLPIEKSGKEICPYCGTTYILEN